MSEDVPWLDSDQQRAWRAYLRGSALLIERLDQDLRALGLSVSEYEVLVQLSEVRDRQIRMSELADSVHQSRSRLTHTIARMERAGLVKRWSCDDDRRGVWAGLTEEGWRRLVNAAPIHVRGVRALLVDAVDPTDLGALERVFTAIAARVAGSTDGAADGSTGRAPDGPSGSAAVSPG